MTGAVSSIQLEAFGAVARNASFSRAAREVHVTQSALSQRIANLEEALGLSLFVRGRGGVRLTEAGLRLVRYCQAKDAMEGELLSDLVSARAGELAGVARVAAYSTVLRSMVLPRLAPLLRENPRVQLEAQTREMGELPGLLLRGETDFLVLDHRLQRAGLEIHELGHESYVLIESAVHRTRAEVYLDHDSDDSMTERFFQTQGQAKGRKWPARLERSFPGEIYSIIDSVRLGLGRAVVPRHLFTVKSGVKVVAGFKPLQVPIVLHFFEQPYYSRLHHQLVAALRP